MIKIKKKGFALVYILPIFMCLIILSINILGEIKSSNKIINSYICKDKARYLCDIGIKHGISISKEKLENKTYYINMIDNNIFIDTFPNKEKNTKVTITIKESLEEINVNITSSSEYKKFYHKKTYSYIVYKENIESNIDNT